MKRYKPLRDDRHYRQLWRIVDGAVRDCIESHPDYFAEGRIPAARLSINKRVVGSVLGYVEQSTRGRSGESSAADVGWSDYQRSTFWGRLLGRFHRLLSLGRQGEGSQASPQPSRRAA